MHFNFCTWLSILICSSFWSCLLYVISFIYFIRFHLTEVCSLSHAYTFQFYQFKSSSNILSPSQNTPPGKSSLSTLTFSSKRLSTFCIFFINLPISIYVDTWIELYHEPKLYSEVMSFEDWRIKLRRTTLEFAIYIRNHAWFPFCKHCKYQNINRE